MPSIEQIKGSDGSGNANVATVQNSRSPGATTIIVDTVLDINPAGFMGTMGTPHTFTDPITSETITVISEATAVDFSGHVDGSNIEIDDIAPGYSDAGSEAGDIVIIRPTTQYADNIAAILGVSHADDGSIQATNPKIITAIKDANGNELLKLVATASAINELTLANAAVGGVPKLMASGDDTDISLDLVPKGAGEVKLNGVAASGAWQSWVPTWANFTTTNLTVTAKYKQIGKTVYFRLHAVGGVSSAAGTGPTFSLPVASVATPSTAMPIGQGNYMSKNAWLSWASTTTALLRCWDVNNDLGTMTATNPATFGNGSVMDFYGQYEAA